MLRARGEILLFADADGATTFSEFGKVEQSLKKLCSGKEFCIYYNYYQYFRYFSEDTIHSFI